MKTIFNLEDNINLRERIDKLSPSSVNQWGKMNAYQMIKHCIMSERMFLGDIEYDRLFIGKLFGKMALKGILKDNAPMKKNQPTHPAFKTEGLGDTDPLKLEWKMLIKRYFDEGENQIDGLMHPFFGLMTKEQIGVYVYKHTDHHLRQFSV